MNNYIKSIKQVQEAFNLIMEAVSNYPQKIETEKIDKAMNILKNLGNLQININDKQEVINEIIKRSTNTKL